MKEEKRFKNQRIWKTKEGRLFVDEMSHDTLFDLIEHYTKELKLVYVRMDTFPFSTDETYIEDTIFDDTKFYPSNGVTNGISKNMLRWEVTQGTYTKYITGVKYKLGAASAAVYKVIIIPIL